MAEKALFVPLKGEYFDAFASGVKTDELRVYGPRWNERTCRVGRPVTLSRGYGKTRRLGGRIRAFKRQHGATFGSTYRAAIERLYGTLDIWIACIGIDVMEEVCLGCGSSTERRDCGCPAGTGLRARKLAPRHRRMPPCATCGHGWPMHVIPCGVENIDIYPNIRECVEDDCRCRNYVEPESDDAVDPHADSTGKPTTRVEVFRS